MPHEYLQQDNDGPAELLDDIEDAVDYDRVCDDVFTLNAAMLATD